MANLVMVLLIVFSGFCIWFYDASTFVYFTQDFWARQDILWFHMSFMIGCDESYFYDFVCLLERGSHYAAKTNLEATVSHRLDSNSRLRSILSQLPSARTMMYTTMAGSPLVC